MSETLFVHGDFQAPCLVWRSGDDVEVTLTAVRPDDIAALMHAMKTVCGATCALIAGGVMTLVQCLRVEGRERRGFRAGGVEFVLGLRALPESKPAAPPEWNTLKIGGVPAPAPADFRYRYTTTTRPLPHPGTAVEALTRFVIGVDLAAPHASGCLVRAAEERRQREAPLVALVAAVPEGLDPIGWRAAVLAVDETRSRGATTIPQESWEAFARDILRGAKPNEEPVGWPDVAVAAYRRALTRQPPPMRPGRALACNAYDVPGQP